VRAERRPNIVVVVADDLGYGDLGAYGGPIPTPHLDALAASGARMTQGYVTAAVCAPSRAGLLAGRHQNRFGFEFNPRGGTAPRRASQRTAPARASKAGGYATGMVGKWHLGMAPGFQPLDQGFDEFYGC
jgi:arylsulfatase A-like enzyme